MVLKVELAIPGVARTAIAFDINYYKRYFVETLLLLYVKWIVTKKMARGVSFSIVCVCVCVVS